MKVIPIEYKCHNTGFTGKILPSKDFSDYKASLSKEEKSTLAKQMKLVERIKDGKVYVYRISYDVENSLRANIFELKQVMGKFCQIPILPSVTKENTNLLFDRFYREYVYKLAEKTL